MSREIKFRVYDKTGGYYVAILDNDSFGIKQTARVILELEMLGHEYIVEQCTDLKDKYGKEIYEGDIVEYDWYIRSGKPAYRVKGQVVFDDMGARLGNDRIRNCTNVVVIGNVHQGVYVKDIKKYKKEEK